MSRWVRFALLLAVLGAWVAVAAQAEAFRNLKEGDAAPDFTLKSTAGQEIRLGALQGKAVAIAFVHQGQEKSEKVLKALAGLDPAVAARTEVVAVLVDTGEGDPAAWVGKMGVSFPVLLDPSKEVYAKYGVFVAPATGVIRPDGVFQGEVAGYSASSKEEIEGLLKVALGLATVEQLSAEAEKAKPVELSKERKMSERELEKAKKLLDRRMKDKALEAVKQAVATDPSYAAAHVFLGRLLLDASDKNADEAQGHFDKALELDPRDADATVGTARVKTVKGDFDGAVSLLETAVQSASKPERVYYQLGIVQEKAGRADQAVKAYRRALEAVLGE
ncbi:MAG: redoxin domain-containing protein [Deltaproteobacteria bacterium]|nr:redoxin domain-containing protein [Deltaproteobacteria bacterium]